MDQDISAGSCQFRTGTLRGCTSKLNKKKGSGNTQYERHQGRSVTLIFQSGNQLISGLVQCPRNRRLDACGDISLQFRKKLVNGEIILELVSSHEPRSSLCRANATQGKVWITRQAGLLLQIPVFQAKICLNRTEIVCVAVITVSVQSHQLNML